MKTVVAWVVGIWTPLQLAMLAVKMWVGTDWHWAVVLVPSEVLGVVLVVAALRFLCMIRSLVRDLERLERLEDDQWTSSMN